MDSGMKDKKVLVTGGGVGIGLAISLALADEGADVAIANRNLYPEAEKEIRGRGGKVVSIKADVSKEEDVNRMVKEAIDGLSGLDCYVNNVAAHWDQPMLKVTSEAWYNTVATNLSSCVFACRETCKHFAKQGSGSILIIASTATYTLFPGEFAYRCTKTALVPYMENLAAEMAPFGVRVNMITPGHFITRMTGGLDSESELYKQVMEAIPMHHPGDAYKDIGPQAVLLLSDKLAGYTTAANVLIDGGIRLRVCPWRSDEETRQMNL